MSAGKWCEYCKKSDHSDSECWCTRAVLMPPRHGMGVSPCYIIGSIDGPLTPIATAVRNLFGDPT